MQRERLSEGGIMYCVYWIRRDIHSDIYSEGYVGITKDLNERIRSHKKNKRRSHFTSAIKKYNLDVLQKEIIHSDLSLEKALEREQHYRPKENIGWNSQRGGYLGVNPEWYDIEENREQHSLATSEATKLGIALKDTSEARSERARVNWVNNRESYNFKGVRNPKAILTEEQVYKIKYDLIPSGLSNTEIANIFNVKHYVICFIRTGKNWSHV